MRSFMIFIPREQLLWWFNQGPGLKDTGKETWRKEFNLMTLCRWEDDDDDDDDSNHHNWSSLQHVPLTAVILSTRVSTAHIVNNTS